MGTYGKLWIKVLINFYKKVVLDALTLLTYINLLCTYNKLIDYYEYINRSTKIIGQDTEEQNSITQENN